jgi:hypothetical protein
VGILIFLVYLLLSVYTFFHYYQYYPLTPSYWLKMLVFPFQGTQWVRSGTQAVLFSLGSGSLFYGLGAYLTGRFILKGLNWEEGCPTNQFILSMGLGGLGLGFIYLSLGLLGVAFDGVIRGFWVILLILGFYAFFIKKTPKTVEKCPFSLKNYHFFHYLTLALLLVSLGIALTPSIESDGMRYHFPIPAQIHQSGLYAYYPINAFFQFPALIEMQFGFAMAGGWASITPQLVHWFHFMLTVFLIGSFSRRWFPKADPALAMAIYASVPFIPIISGWAFIESSLTFYFLCALWLLLQLGEAKNSAEIKKKSLLAGIFIGALAGMKYSLLALFPPLVGLALYYLWKKEGKKALSPALIFIISLGIAACPFYLRNLVNTGNPVYPLGYNLFGGDYWSQANGDYYLYHAQQKGGLYESKQENILYRGAELIYLPIKASLNPPGYGLKYARENSRFFALTGSRIFLPDNFGEWQITPFFLIFLPLAVFYYFRKSKNADSNALIPWLLLAFCAWYYLSWANSYRDNRFLMPILPLLALLTAEGICGWENKLVKYLAVGLILYNTLWMGQIILKEHNPLPWLAGRISQEDYLASKLNYYPADAEWNAHHQPNETLLLVGEYRPSYLQGTYYDADFFDTPYLLRIMQGAATKEEVYARMKELKIGQILYNANENSLYLHEYARHFSPYVDIDLYRQIILDIQQGAKKAWPIDRELNPGEQKYYAEFLGQPETSPQTDPRKIFLYQLPR